MVDLVVVPESQVLNLAYVNLAMGHEVLHEVVSMTLLRLIWRLHILIVDLNRLLSRDWRRSDWRKDFFWTGQ